MGAVDAGGEDEFGGDDAHGLFFEVWGDTADDGGVVEEAGGFKVPALPVGRKGDGKG